MIPASRWPQRSPHQLILLCLAAGWLVESGHGLELVGSLSQHGVRGEIRFRQDGDHTSPVQVKLDLHVSEGAEGEYSWGIYEFPIDYTQEDYCHSRYLGRKPRVNLDELSGSKLILPAGLVDPDQIIFQDDEDDDEVAGEVAQPPPKSSPLEMELTGLALMGPDSIWGASLVLEGPSRERICATLLPDVPDGHETVAEARFNSPIGGSVYFHTLVNPDNGEVRETKIFTNLYHLQEGSKSSDHPWQIYITDILGSNRKRETCNFLQILYDPKGRRSAADSSGCSEDNPAGCAEGDLSGKFGKARVGRTESMFTKKYLTDYSLQLPELRGSSRNLYLALFDPEHPDSFIACAQIFEIKERIARAEFRHDGIVGDITFSQRSRFHPAVSYVNLTGLSGGAGSYHVHEFPVPPRASQDDAPCGKTGAHFNPFRVDKSSSPASGTGSSDRYEVGDLSGKYGELNDRYQVMDRQVDPAINLFGQRSVLGRSVVIHKSPIPHRWVCANIELAPTVDKDGKVKLPEILTAEARFTYPVGGRIVFRQDVNDPLADTSVYVEGLLYTDGTRNSSAGHRWHVHEEMPGRDFFNWTGRCLSAGQHFDPYRIDATDSCLNDHKADRCEVGDLVSKHGSLAVSGRRKAVGDTRRFFTDPNLPLTGSASILGHSIVLHDDKAPEHRGDRMACTPIRRVYRHKGVAREWFGNGILPPVTGRLEFIQDTAMSATHTLVDLKNLDGDANSYHVHEIGVQPQLEFACSGDALGGHFNPWNWDPTVDRNHTHDNEQDTPDLYEVGDLSGKYGGLSGKLSIREVHNDTNLPMFGQESIVGRSVVIHKATDSERWACSTIGWGWDPDEAGQVTAIASFHHPEGYAWGYIRFSQVVYKDGSSTDTVIEVRLKYPGKTNRKSTSGHRWAVYVNPVGHDAAVKFRNARCTAAGYRWNPTFIQLADPNDRDFYDQECGSDFPLRCEVGDLSGRHGPISVGGKAFIFNDMHLPLFGDWFNSALGKSIVIHDPDGGPDVMACANIEPDKDIIKYANIRTLATFNLAQFIEEIQAVMGVPDWYLFIDARHTKKLHEGQCLQVLIHFRGPHAGQLEQDFSRLLRTGRQDSPSIAIPGYTPPRQRKTQLSYRECGNEKLSSAGIVSGGSGAIYSKAGPKLRQSHWLAASCAAVIFFVWRVLASGERTI